jgi:DNA-binding transcriptional ArsR family regulator
MTEELPQKEIYKLLAHIFSAMSDSSRVQILCVLSSNAACVNDLSNTLDLTQPATSRHLKILRNGGLVKAERDGRSINYSLADPRIVDILKTTRDILADQLESQGQLSQNVRYQIHS